MTVQMLGSGKRFPTRREGTAKLLLNTVNGALGAGGGSRGDGGGTGACRRHIEALMRSELKGS